MPYTLKIGRTISFRLGPKGTGYGSIGFGIFGWPYGTLWLALWNPNLVCGDLKLVAGARGAPTHCKTAYKSIMASNHDQMVGDALRRAQKKTVTGGAQLPTTRRAGRPPPTPFGVHGRGWATPPHAAGYSYVCAPKPPHTHTHTPINWCHVATLP